VVAKKLMIEPGRYDGSLVLDGAVFRGQLDLRGRRRPVGTVFEMPNNTSPINGLSFYPADAASPGVLRGQLDNGLEIALSGATLTHSWPGRTRLRADTALVGRDVPDDLLFNCVWFQVGGLTELATVRPMSKAHLPSMPAAGSEFIATWGEHGTQAWTMPDGDDITLQFAAAMSDEGFYGFSVTTSPLMSVSGKPRSAAEWMSSYVLPLAELTTFATDHRQPVSWVYLFTQDRPTSPVQVFSEAIDDQAAYDASQPAADSMISDSHASLIPLGPAGANLAHVLTGWASLRADHRALHDHLTLRRREDSTSDRAVLLSAVPALEAFHDQLHGRPPAGPAEQVRNEVLARVGELPGLSEEDREYLDRRLALPEGYKLAHRLATIADRDLGAALRNLITKRTDPLPDGLVLENTQNQTIWETLATARNRIGHGKDTVPAPEQTRVLALLAHCMAIAVALGRLGVPDDALRSVIESSSAWLSG
jgi:hypothetical protein